MCGLIFNVLTRDYAANDVKQFNKAQEHEIN